LLLQKDPSLEQADVEQILRDTALDIPNTGSRNIWDNVVPATITWDTDCGGVVCNPVGYGLIQVDAAIDSIP